MQHNLTAVQNETEYARACAALACVFWAVERELDGQEQELDDQGRGRKRGRPNLDNRLHLRMPTHTRTCEMLSSSIAAPDTRWSHHQSSNMGEFEQVEI